MNEYIGARIRRKRKELGLSLNQLAEFLNLSYQQVQKYESGASKVTAEMLMVIAQVLREPIEYFYQDIKAGSQMLGVAADPSIISPTRQRALQVMLVDDNLNDAMLVQTVAKEFDFIGEITVEQEAAQVVPTLLGRVRTKSQNLPDMVMLEVSLRRGDAMDVLKAIKSNKELQHIVVILYTNSVSWETMMRGYKLGANGYTLKSHPEIGQQGTLRELFQYWGQYVIFPTM